MLSRNSLPFVFLSLVFASACHHGSTTDTSIHVSIEDGRLVYTDSIRFESDSAQLATGSTDVLDAIGSFLRSQSGIASIRVEGNTDSHGTAGHNDTLSAERAQAVADYLRAHGVTQTVTTIGHGASAPLCTEATEECDARNRRVEFFVTAE